MNNSFVVDTNILVYFFDGNKNAGKLINNIELSISSITYIELLSNKFNRSSAHELTVEFLTATSIVHTNAAICEFAAKFRTLYPIKIPDAIIAATAKYLNVPIITADKQFFMVKEIEIIKFQK